MATHCLPYGRGSVEIDLPHTRQFVVETLAPQAANPAADPHAEVEAALGGRASPSLPRRRVRNRNQRPDAARAARPSCSRRSSASSSCAGVAPEDILFVIATGTHPPMPGRAVRRSRACRDPQTVPGRRAMMPAARTARSSSVTRRAARRRGSTAVTSTVRSASSSGRSSRTSSSGSPVASRARPSASAAPDRHPQPLEDGRNRQAQIGRYNDNPCRQDIEEIGRRIGVHFALNVVLGDAKGHHPRARRRTPWT